MSTWFPESPSDDDRPDRPRYPGVHGDDPYPPAGESYEPPTRRSAQAAGAGYDDRPGRNGSAPEHETQFLPPAVPPGVDQGGYPAAGYPPSYPEYADEFVTGPRYDDLSGPVGAGTGRTSPGPGPATPPGHGADPLGPPAGVPSAGQPVGSYGGPQYADLPPGGPQYSRPPHPEPEGPADQPVPDRSETSSGRSRGGELHGRASGQSLSRILAALAWPVMAIGLFMSEAGGSAFSRVPAWSAFALGCLVLVGVGAFGGAQGPGSGRTWTLGVVGAVGLGAFWVLLVLPSIARNTSFMLTLGTALAAAGVWLAPGRGRG